LPVPANTHQDERGVKGNQRSGSMWLCICREWILKHAEGVIKPFVMLEKISYLPAQPNFGFPRTTSRAVHTKLGPAALVTLTLRNSAVQKPTHQKSGDRFTLALFSYIASLIPFQPLSTMPKQTWWKPCLISPLSRQSADICSLLREI